VLAGDFNNELMEGVALYPGTAAPGTPWHGLIFGHSSQERWIKNEYSTIFAKLYELEVGDTFSITRKWSLYRYRMVEQVVVQPENVIDIYNKRNKDRHHISLISCWPLGTRRRRMVVTAELIDTPTTTTLLSYNQ
jgi:LPXTG-site transpeptidase (sortase) family protein